MERFPSYRVRETLLYRKPREYSRDVAVISVLMILWITLLAWQNSEALLPTFAATSNGVLGNQEYWRLLTSVAVHADFGHFLSNIIFVAIFSYLLFGYYGIWVYPVLGVALAGLTNYLSLLTYPVGTSLIGASGLVYWMAGFWLSMYLMVERSLGIGKRSIRAVGVALIVLFPSTFQENVSYRTHAIGFGLGVVSAFAYFQRNRHSIRAAEVIEVEDPIDYSEQSKLS